MCAMYDASYRPGIMMRDGDVASRQHHQQHESFLEPSTACSPYDLENSHEYPNEECSDVGSDEFVNYPGHEQGMLRGITGSVVGAMGIGGSILETGKRLFYQQRQCVQMGEGPTLLRLLCFLGGFAMLSSSVLSMINIFSLFTGPSTYVLQMYQGFFGIITMVVEAKDWECLDQFKPWMIEWFRFLTVPAGKGAFYIFVGSLGVSLWVRNLLAFTVGLYMSAMGLICVAVHAGTSRKSYNTDNYGDHQREEMLADGYNYHGPPDRLLQNETAVSQALAAAFHDGAGLDPFSHDSDSHLSGLHQETTTTTTSATGVMPLQKQLRKNDIGTSVKNGNSRHINSSMSSMMHSVY